MPSDIAALETHLDSLHFWLVLWTAVVVVGLIREYWSDVAKLLSNKVNEPGLTACAPMVRLPLISPAKRVMFWGLVGGIIVTLGVAGELYVEFQGSRIDNQLRLANDQAITEGQTKLAETVFEEQQLEADAALLVASLQPRHIPQIYIDSQRHINSGQFEASLKCCFSGINVIVRSVQDNEAQALACEIVSFAKRIGWSAELEVPQSAQCSQKDPYGELMILSPWKYPVVDRERIEFGVTAPQTMAELTLLAAHRLSEYWNDVGLDNIHIGFDQYPNKLGQLAPNPNLILILVGSRRIDARILDRVQAEAWRKAHPGK